MVPDDWSTLDDSAAGAVLEDSAPLNDSSAVDDD